MFNKYRPSMGFTLMEMLVVVAIIAVLVSIVVPTVTNATNRAACAANAANLRVIKAEVTLAYQNEDFSKYKFTETGDDITVETIAPTPPAQGTDSPDCASGEEMVITYTKNPFQFMVTYGTITAEEFAAGAEGRYVPSGENP